MARYLEYDKTTGRIISEIISASKPEVSGNYDVLEVADSLKINTALYCVRLERERVKKEHGEQIRRRIKAMMYEVIIAILDDNENALNDLKAEYKSLKGYL